MLETINGHYIVIGVSGLIGALAYTSQWFILAPALGGWSSQQTLKYLGPLNLGILILCYYYYLAINTDPGKAPEGWEPPYSLIQTPDQVQANKGETGPRYCRSCDAYKPPRAHHCRVCRRCILKMDHHCPWINNCVGHGNYPYFFRFVFFVSLTCGYALYLLVWRLMQIIDTNSLRNALRPVRVTEMIFMVFNVAGVFITMFAVSLLTLYHGYCIFKGQSTIESWERSKVKNLIKKRKITSVEFPYDLGSFNNICSVLGNNPLFWLFPRSCVGDGLSYTLRPDTDPKLPYYWPPRDPDDLRPSIYDRQEQQQRKEQQRYQSNQPRLVRRDSEGYLVREISVEERMTMLANTVEEYGYMDETTTVTTETETVIKDNNDTSTNLGDHHPIESNDTTAATYPAFYYYDSGSESDGDYMDDGGQMYNGRYDKYMEQIDDDESLWEDLNEPLGKPPSMEPNPSL